MKPVILLAALLLPGIAGAQTLPYSSIAAYPDKYTAGTVAARAIDGLGFRFYWATDGLRESDLAYKPGTGTRTSLETVEHIYEMSFLIVNAPLKKINTDGQNKKLPFAEMRKKTLENFKAASELLFNASDEEMRSYKVLFTDGSKTFEYPYWNLINGPTEDCIWHAGQIVAFRRASGNPIRENVDFFTGK